MKVFTGKYAPHSKNRLNPALLLLLTLSFFLCACSGPKDREERQQIVLTADFADDEIFRINSLSCYLYEARIYMKTSFDLYTEVMGREFWTKPYGGEVLRGKIKENILSRLAQVKAMNLLAADRQIVLTEEEAAAASAAASRYLSGMSGQEALKLGAGQEELTRMYEEYALACKVYDDITKDVNPEISDDEARTILLKQIFIPYGRDDKDEARRLAAEAHRRAVEGEPFDNLAVTYNKAENSSLSLRRGEAPPSLEKAAFDLSKDEISRIIETDEGFYLLQCISTFDAAETDSSKQRIIQERKKETFEEVYKDFIESLYSNLNEKLWEKEDFSDDGVLIAKDFFSVYEEFFPGNAGG